VLKWGRAFFLSILNTPTVLPTMPCCVVVNKGGRCAATSETLIFVFLRLAAVSAHTIGDVKSFLDLAQKQIGSSFVVLSLLVHVLF
jgi:hypothetical protein